MLSASSSFWISSLASEISFSIKERLSSSSLYFSFDHERACVVENSRDEFSSDFYDGVDSGL